MYKVIKAKDIQELADKLNKENSFMHIEHIQPTPHASKLGYEVLVKTLTLQEVPDERTEEV